VRPGDEPDVINLRSGGTVPIAVLSSPTFDARAIDPRSVILGSAVVKSHGIGEPMASVEDVNDDGLADLVLHFRIANLGLTESDTTIELTGFTFDGMYVHGITSVVIR
jgi:hypothetical protein